MEPDRWQKIERIFAEAVALTADEREAFVKENCGGDDEMCREILRLLLEDAENDAFLSEPLFTNAMRLLENDFAGLPETGEFGRYKLIKLIGRGGMGAVFLARDTSLEREVALKILPPGIAENEESISRFRQEARAASAVSHPNVAHIYEFGESDGRYFLAMEYVEGCTLRTLIKEKSLTPAQIFNITVQIAEALAVMHRRGIVHRDIKPENVIVGDLGLVKILDFGLAKLNQPTEDQTLASLETKPGMIIGTTAYMSPEQVRGQALDARSDLWSLGVMLFEMLADDGGGERPFAGETASDVQAAILLKDAPLEKVPTATAIVVGRLLKKSLAERYQSAEEFLEDFRPLKNYADSGRNFPDAGESAAEEINGIGNENGFLGTEKKGFFSRRGISLVLPLLIFALTAVFGIVYFNKDFRRAVSGESGQGQDQSKKIGSLVVQPFQNRTGDAQFDFLSEGLAEDLTRNLGSLNLTRVLSFSSGRRMRDVSDVAEIKRRLNVGAVLRGAVERDGENLFVNAEIVDTASGATLWKERLNAASGEFLKTRNALSSVIVNEFQRLTGNEKRLVLADYGTRSDKAYRAYLEGKYAPDRSTAEGIRRAIVPLERAVALDPNYAQAYVALADAYNLLGTWHGSDPETNQLKAKQFVEKAISLDEGMSEAHTTLAKIEMDYERDWAATEREFRRAIELNPNNALAHHWYGEVFLSAMGRFDESVRELEIARELNPVSSGILTALAWTYIGKRDYQKAIELCDEALKLNPKDAGAFSFKAMALMKLERYNEALEASRRAEEINGDQESLERGVIYGVSGETEKAREILRRLEQKARTSKDISNYDLAVIHAAIGEKDRAFELLHKEIDSKSVDLLSIRVDPLLDTLRDDGRFKQLDEKLNLPK